MTFFTQSSTTSSTIEPTSIDSFTKIDWDLVRQNVKAFDIYRQLANQTGISLQECFFNNKVDLSPYEIEDPEIQNYISSVPLFSELEKKYPFTIDRSNSLFPTTHRRNISKNMLGLSMAVNSIWRMFPVINDNDRQICLKMLKNRQHSRRDKVMLQSFNRMGIVLWDLLMIKKHENNVMIDQLPCNRDAFFRIFGEYAHKNIKTDNAVRYSINLNGPQIWLLCQENVIDPFLTYEEAEKLVYCVHKHGIECVIENKKSLF